MRFGVYMKYNQQRGTDQIYQRETTRMARITLLIAEIIKICDGPDAEHLYHNWIRHSYLEVKRMFESGLEFNVLTYSTPQHTAYLSHT